MASNIRNVNSLFYVHSPRESDQPKRTPRKARLYYKQRLERERHAAEVSALKAEIAKLCKLVGNPKTDGDSAKKLKAYNTLTKKLKTHPTKARVALVHRVTSPRKLKQRRITSQLARDVSLDRRSISSVHKGPVLRFEKSENRKERVLTFLQLPDHSVTLAGKKDTVTVNGKKKQKVILTQFLKPLHEEYNKQNPDKLVSLSFFKKVRGKAKFIKTLNYQNTSVCLCMRQKLRSIASCGIPTIPDTLVKDYTKETLKARLDAAQMPDIITFQMWKRIQVPYGDPENPKVAMKLRPVEQSLPKTEFIAELLAEFPGIVKHVLRATSQHQSIRSLRQQLTAQECTIQMDFAQNWNVGYSGEVQSAFYAKEAITVHPVVIHLRSDDGTVCDCLCIVSDDRQHDSGAILAIMEILTTYLKDNYPLIKTMHYCSDSPSSQDRNISLFSVIAKHQELFGLSCTWAYFEAGHGKGPCDGVGAAAKRKADNTLKRGINIQNAEDFARVGNMEGNVTYIHMPLTASYQGRRKIATLMSVRKVPCTMQVHAVVTLIPSQKIAVRETSCYRDCCWSNQQPKMGCSGWKQHTLFDQPPNEPPQPTTDIPTEKVEETGTAADSTAEVLTEQGTVTTADATAEVLTEGTAVDATAENPTEGTVTAADVTAEVLTEQGTVTTADATAEVLTEGTAVDATAENPTEGTVTAADVTAEVLTEQGTVTTADATAEVLTEGTAVDATAENPTEGTVTAADVTAEVLTEQGTVTTADATAEVLTEGTVTAADATAHQPKNQPKNQPKYSVGDFIVSVYNNMWYVGKVIKILEDDEYEVTFMKATDSNPPKYWWPAPEDKLAVCPEDIMLVVPPPTVTGSSMRKKYHILMPAVLAEIDKKFATFF